MKNFISPSSESLTPIAERTLRSPCSTPTNISLRLCKWCDKCNARAKSSIVYDSDRTIATFVIPPSCFRLFLARGPKKTSRKLDPWLSSRDCKNPEVSSLEVCELQCRAPCLHHNHCHSHQLHHTDTGCWCSDLLQDSEMVQTRDNLCLSQSSSFLLLMP